MNAADCCFHVTRDVVVPTDAADAMFARISRAVEMERLGRGRRGGLAVRCRADDGAVPLMRSTTQMSCAPVPFPDVLERLLPAAANHAAIERYGSCYQKMAFHSDHAQDLADDSTISIYSWYKDPARADRQLVVRRKTAAAAAAHDTFVIPLEHNSVVQFTAATNREWLHKIVLAHPATDDNQQWLGVTARTSKTFVRFDGAADGPPRFVDIDRPLRLAVTDAEQREVFRVRRQENTGTGGVVHYASTADYTLSASDLMKPTAITPLDPDKITISYVYLDNSEREQLEAAAAEVTVA